MTDDEPDRDHRSARDRRLEYQARWVDLQVQRAIERGDFDDLPGSGKPIDDLGTTHDPDWWIKRLVERERISVLPAALALRVEDERLEETLDEVASERRVREILVDFNARVVAARRQLQGGPPVITPLRDVDAEVEAWRNRRRARRARIAHQAVASDAAPKPRWWRRLRASGPARPDSRA